MLLSGGFLPHGLISTYEDYKRNTKSLIKWLKDNGSNGQEVANQEISLSTLFIFAENIKRKGIQMPRNITFAFRDAIAHRTQVSGWFSKQSSEIEGIDLSTLRHEKFTETLQEIYGSLSALGVLNENINTGGSRVKSHGKDAVVTTPGKENLGTTKPSPNRFQALPVNHNLEETLEQPPSTMDSTELPSHPKKTSSKKVCGEDEYDLLMSEMGLIMDDGMAMFVESLLSLMHLDAILLHVRSSWARAARDEIPFSVAALISRTAWNWAWVYLTLLSKAPWVRTFSLLDLFLTQVKFVGLPPGWTCGDLPESTECTYGDGLALPLKIMMIYVQEAHVWKNLTFRDTVKYIKPKPNPADSVIFGVLIRDQTSYTSSKWDLNVSEPMSITQDWLKCEIRGCHCLRVSCAFHLRLQLEAFRGYLWPKQWGSPSLPVTVQKQQNPRGLFLDFVREASHTLEKLGDHPALQNCCEGSLGQECKFFGKELLDYTKKAFAPGTAYFQFPMTAGHSVLKLCHTMYDLGMRLSNHRHHVASILHVYNALIELGDIKPINVLDELCSIFEDVIFLGARPKQNFSSCFTRHRGGKVQYHGDAGYGQNLGSNESWALEVKDYQWVDGEHREANHTRFNPGVDHTIFRDVMDIEHMPRTDWFWAHALGYERWMRPTEKERAAICKWIEACARPEQPLMQVEIALCAEFSGKPIPFIGNEVLEAKDVNIKVGKSAKARNNQTTKTPVECPCGRPHPKAKDPVTVPKIRIAPEKLETTQHKTISGRSVAAVERRKGTGRLPVSKINYGNVWIACADAFASVNSDGVHNGSQSKETSLTCLCAVDVFLMEVDAYTNRSKKSMKFNQKKLRQNWVRAVEMFRGRGFEEFLWKSLGASCRK